MNRKNTMVTLTLAAMMFTSTLTPIHAEGTIGWVENNGVWSYVQEDGTKAIGWLKDGDCWYYLNEDGSMKTGWIASSEHWYYLGLSGVMQKDYQVEENGKTYYLKANGIMAKEYVKDGIEYDKEGIGRSVSETNSVVIRNAQDLKGLTSVEGNLYVTEAVAEDLELSGIEIKGTLVIQAANRTVSLKDTHVETVSIQGRESKVVLNGTSGVNKVVLERGATLEAAKGYQGNVGNVEIQSSVTEPSVIDLKADEVGIRTYSEVTVNSPIKAVTVSTDTTVHVNADIETVVVQGNAAGTVVEVSKGSTIGTVVADAQTTLDGKGTVNKVEANVNGVEAGKDTVIKDVEAGKDVSEKPAVNKPSSGGGTSSGGSSRPTPVTYVVSFDMGDSGLTAPASQSVNSGSKLTIPSVEGVAEGMKISWYKEDGEFFDIENDKVTGSMTLKAVLGSDKFTGGDGTEEYPYLIGDNTQFYAIKDLENAMKAGKAYHFKQLANITDLTMGISEFCGSYDGQGYSISATESGNGTITVFGSPYGDTVIKNITLISSSSCGLSVNIDPWYVDNLIISNIRTRIKGSYLNLEKANYASIISGTIYDARQGDNNQQTITIEDCDIEINVQNSGHSTAAFIGGGYCYEGKNPLVTIRNSHVNGEIRGNNYAGLIIGNPSYNNNLPVLSEEDVSDYFVVENIEFNGFISASSCNIFSVKSNNIDDSFIFNEVYGDTIEGDFEIRPMMNKLEDKSDLKVYKNDAEYIINDDEYTYKLAFNVHAITVETGIMNSRNVLVELSSSSNCEDLPLLETGASVHAYDENRFRDLGLVDESFEIDYLYRCENIRVGIVELDGKTYLIFDNNSVVSVDSGVNTLIYGYEGKVLIGTKLIKQSNLS